MTGSIRRLLGRTSARDEPGASQKRPQRTSSRVTDIAPLSAGLSNHSNGHNDPRVRSKFSSSSGSNHSIEASSSATATPEAHYRILPDRRSVRKSRARGLLAPPRSESDDDRSVYSQPSRPPSAVRPALKTTESGWTRPASSDSSLEVAIGEGDQTPDRDRPPHTPVEMMLELAIQELTDVRQSVNVKRRTIRKSRSKVERPPSPAEVDEWPYGLRVLVDQSRGASKDRPIEAPWLYAFVESKQQVPHVVRDTAGFFKPTTKYRFVVRAVADNRAITVDATQVRKASDEPPKCQLGQQVLVKKSGQLLHGTVKSLDVRLLKDKLKYVYGVESDSSRVSVLESAVQALPVSISVRTSPPSISRAQIETNVLNCSTSCRRMADVCVHAARV